MRELSEWIQEEIRAMQWEIREMNSPRRREKEYRDTFRDAENKSKSFSVQKTRNRKEDKENKQIRKGDM